MWGWNKGWNKKKTRSKLCQSPGSVEEMSRGRVGSMECGVLNMEDGSIGVRT